MLHAELTDSGGDDGRGGSRRMATFFLTSRCNLRCDYCYALENADLDREDWDPADAEPLIKVFARHGYRVALGGGEPTVSPARLFSVLDLCRSHGVPCSLLTNGRLLSDERLLRTLREKECRWIQVSVDRAEDVRLLEPVFATGRRLGLPMAAGTVTSAPWASEIPGIYDFLGAIGAVGWRILKRTVWSDRRPERHGDDWWYYTMLGLEKHVRSRPSPVRIRYEPGLVPLEWYRGLPVALRPPVCGARTVKRVFVYPNGMVFACGLPRTRALLLGNYRTDLKGLEARIARPPVLAVHRPGDPAYCREECRGGCLQHRIEGRCDSRCRIDERLIPICCYEKLPLAPADPALTCWLPSTVYATRAAAHREHAS